MRAFTTDGNRPWLPWIFRVMHFSTNFIIFMFCRLPDTPHKCDSCRLSFDTDDSSPIANNRADFALSGRKRFRSKRRLQSSVPISPLAMEMNNDESLLASDTAVAEAEDEKFMDLFEKKHEKVLSVMLNYICLLFLFHFLNIFLILYLFIHWYNPHIIFRFL